MGSHDRCPASHRFQNRQTETLVERRENQDAGPVVQLNQRFLPSTIIDDPYLPPQLERFQGFEYVIRRPAAFSHQDEWNSGPVSVQQEPIRRKQGGYVFPWLQRAYKQDIARRKVITLQGRHLIGRRGQRSESLVGRQVNGGHLVWQGTEQVDKILPRLIRVSQNVIRPADGPLDLSRIVAEGFRREILGKVHKAKIMDSDDHASGTERRRDKIGRVQQVQPMAQQLPTQCPPLQAVVTRRPGIHPQALDQRPRILATLDDGPINGRVKPW